MAGRKGAVASTDPSISTADSVSPVAAGGGQGGWGGPGPGDGPRRFGVADRGVAGQGAGEEGVAARPLPVLARQHLVELGHLEGGEGAWKARRRAGGEDEVGVRSEVTFG